MRQRGARERGRENQEGGPRGATKALTGAVGARIAAAVLAIGVLLGIAGLFPAYFTGQSLASTSDQLVPHVMDLVAWAAAAVLALLGGPRARIGGLLGSGLSAVTFGLFASDLATATAGHDGRRGWHGDHPGRLVRLRPRFGPWRWWPAGLASRLTARRSR